jgi:hypothetical protein
MPKIIQLTRATAIFVIALLPLLSNGQSTASASPTLSGLKPLPQFPSSSSLLQAALNDYNTCIANTLSASQNSATTAATTIVGQCATQQAKLKQMLPPDAYNQGVANTQQYVSKVMAAQSAARTVNP